MPPGQPPRPPPRWPLGLALVLVSAGVWDVAADLVWRRAVPTREAWKAAGHFVRAHHRRGDLIVTAPAWADPLGRLQVGDLMTVDDVTRPDARTYSRIWELSIRGRRHPDTLYASPSQRQTFGRVRVTLYNQTPAKVTADLYEQIAKATVWDEGSGGRHPCRWRPGQVRHDCGPDWRSVRQIRAEIGYEARRCVLVMPADGTVRVIDFPAVRLGGSLVLWTGLRGYDPRYRARRAVWDYRRYRAGRWRGKRPPRPVTAVPVTLRVLVDGREVARLRHDVHDESWRRHVLALGPTQRGDARAVQLRVETRHAWAKHFCFYARSEEAAP